MWLAKPSAESHCAKRSRLGSGWRPPEAALSASGAVPLAPGAPGLALRSWFRSAYTAPGICPCAYCCAPAVGCARSKLQSNTISGAPLAIRDCSSPALISVVQVGMGVGERAGGGGAAGGGGGGEAVIARGPARELWSGWGAARRAERAAGDGGFQRSMLFRRRARGGPLPQNGRHDAAAHDQGHADPADRRYLVAPQHAVDGREHDARVLQVGDQQRAA